MNMMCRSWVVPLLPLAPPAAVELLVLDASEPKVRSIEVGFISKNTFKILKTIKLVTRALTAKDAAKPIIVISNAQRAV